MPLGESIAEFGIRFLLELIFYTLFYWIGFLVIKMVSFGTIKLAPLGTIEEKNRRNKGKKIDWRIWLHRPRQEKVLKAEVVCFVGMIISGLACYLVYLMMKQA